MRPRCRDTKLLCHGAQASIALPGVSIAHIGGDKPLVLWQGVTCPALAQDLWDDRITRWRVPPAFDLQCPRHPDEAVVVPLVVEIQAFHGSSRQGPAGVRALLSPLRCDPIATCSAPDRATTRRRSADAPPAVRGGFPCPRVGRREVPGNEVIFPPLALRTRYSTLALHRRKDLAHPGG